LSQGPDNLDELLAAAFLQARAALPEIDLPQEPFARFLTARLDAEATQAPERALDGLNVPDLYLACACSLGNGRGVELFVQRHLAQVPRYLARLNPEPGLADEVRQELSRKLLVASPPDPPHIDGYRGRGSLESWVAVSAQRMALTLLQRQQRAGVPVEVNSLERALAESMNPEIKLAKAHLKKNFEEAIRHALAGLSSRDRTLLRLTIVSGMGCRQLGVIYRVHSATVARWLTKIREDLLASIQGFLHANQGIDAVDLPSMLGFARSQIDVSLKRLLEDLDPPGEPDVL
jgi:RNA polymerase sigma-70 factor, ECF subfamily